MLLVILYDFLVHVLFMRNWKNLLWLQVTHLSLKYDVNKLMILISIKSCPVMSIRRFAFQCIKNIYENKKKCLYFFKSMDKIYKRDVS